MTIKANARDIVVTWPKGRTLESYVTELKKAERAGLVINYRVANLPRELPSRCYMVHDGFVRGYTTVIEMGERDDVRDPLSREFMRPGLYIVRRPRWFPLAEDIPMRGFQGWRYFERSLTQGRAVTI